MSAVARPRATAGACTHPPAGALRPSRGGGNGRLDPVALADWNSGPIFAGNRPKTAKSEANKKSVVRNVIASYS